jgi:bisphosphoglycerate-independent phosphoglycerate mutase (AlkP superfamily)
MPEKTLGKQWVMADAVRAAYRAGQGDEQLEPLVLVDDGGTPVGRIQDGDYVIFYDLRGEREIELTQSFTEPAFDKFPRPVMHTPFVTMIEYDRNLNVRVAFPPTGEIKDTLPHVVAALLSQRQERASPTRRGSLYPPLSPRPGLWTRTRVERGRRGRRRPGRDRQP